MIKFWEERIEKYSSSIKLKQEMHEKQIRKKKMSKWRLTYLMESWCEEEDHREKDRETEDHDRWRWAEYEWSTVRIRRLWGDWWSEFPLKPNLSFIAKPAPKSLSLSVLAFAYIVHFLKWLGLHMSNEEGTLTVPLELPECP